MATSKTAAPAADTVNTAADAAEINTATPTETPTPENTPVPGGGRWRWDIAAPGWVDQDAAPADPAA